MMCGQAALVNPGKSAFRAISLMCRCWSCPVCAPRRKHELELQIAEGRPKIFLTLTVNPATGYSVDDRARNLAHAWATMARRIKREMGWEKLPYLALFEQCKSGEAHLHIALRCKFIPHKWLKAQLKKLTGAEVVFIERCREAGALARYLAKYLTKDPHRFEGTKRYWSTRDWDLPPGEVEPEDERWSPAWYVVRRAVPELKRLWASWGWDTAMEGKMLVTMEREPP